MILFILVLKDNQAELQQLKDHHQQEIASLQGTYSKRIAQMNKKHQAELEDLVNENESLLSEIKEYERKTGMFFQFLVSTVEDWMLFKIYILLH